MQVTSAPAPSRRTRTRRIVGLSLILGSVGTAVALPLSVRAFGQMEVLWFICHWFRYLGPASILLGLLLLVPDSRQSPFEMHVWGLFGILSLLALLGIAGLGLVHGPHTLRLTWTMRELEDPGPYEAVVLEAFGRWELDSTVWARRAGAGRFERIASPDYPPCLWPIELRRSPGKPRYLVVDSRMRAVALYDLRAREVAWALEELPPLRHLRSEFGDDLASISTFEDELHAGTESAGTE